MQSSGPDGGSILERLREWAIKQPAKSALSFLDDRGELILNSLSYAELEQMSTWLAVHLLNQERLVVGDRVLLVYMPSLDFIVAFLGCIKAGVIAVPCFPPDPRKLNKDLKMFATIAGSCDAKAVLTSASYSYATKLGSLQSAFASLASSSTATLVWPEKLQWIVTDPIIAVAATVTPSEEQQQQLLGARAQQEVAFLQYTSGSTSEPKGVIVTKSALSDNLMLITTGLAAVADTVVVSWLPQYHDMGLIGSYLGAVYCGGSGYYMSPLAFVRNPVAWVHAMSRYRATHVQAPNFAYALTARKFLAARAAASRGRPAEQAAVPLDLSSLRHMINAAEPVEAAAIDMFYAVFAQHGLRPGVVFPTYGLAEHTVYVCSNGRQRLVVDKAALEARRRVLVLDNGADLLMKGSGAAERSEVDDDSSSASATTVQPVVLMGCGRPADSAGLTLCIVDTEAGAATPLAEDCVGEIWLKSRSCAAGYWGLPELSAQDFNGTLAPSSSSSISSSASASASVSASASAPSSSSSSSSSHPSPASPGAVAGVGGFLRTGDLGFLHAGELFVCGRVKDLVIIRGRNHYPQDIERTAEGLLLPGTDQLPLRGGCSAAFSVPLAGREQLVYVAELSDAVYATHRSSASGGTSSGSNSALLSSLMASIRQAVSTTHGVTPTAILLLEPRSIAKTSSGKIARQWVRRAYLSGELKVVGEWDAADAADEGFEVSVTPTSSLMSGEAGANGDGDTARFDGHDSAIDPTGMSMEEVLPALQRAVAECLEAQAAEAAIDAGGAHRGAVAKVDPLRLSADASLVALGMDSMRGIQLQALLEALFTVQLPDALMFEPDATLRTLASALISGGHVKQRPVMVDGWKLVAAARKRAATQPKGKAAPRGALTPQWFREHEVKADVDSHCFPDNCALRLAPMVDPPSSSSSLYSWLLESYLIALSLAFYGVFVWVPCLLIVLLVVVPGYLHLVSFPVVLSVVAVLLAVVYAGPWDRWPPGMRLGFDYECTCRYFSYRVIVEKKAAFVGADGNPQPVPSIYTFGPHGVFSLGPAIQALQHEFLLGDNFHLLVASAALCAPVYNVFCRLAGFRPCDRDTFAGLLRQGRSVGVIPGGIAEMFEAGRDRATEVMTVRQRKGFVRIALETGAQIVPCYCFGNSQVFHTPATDGNNAHSLLARCSRALRTSLVVFWGRWGLPVPLRVPLLTVIGTPIPCPKVDEPSPELVNEYHDLYLRETRRIYEKYRNTYGWRDKPLVFMR